APDGGVPVARPAPSLRLFGGRAAPDSEVMQSLVFPSVGALKAGNDKAQTARDGERALPSALDVAAWLGCPEAKAVLRESGDDGYDGYDAALEELFRRRPPEHTLGRHASVYVSSLDALATYAAGSAADKSQPGASTSAWSRRKIEVTLAAWSA